MISHLKMRREDVAVLLQKPQKHEVLRELMEVFIAALKTPVTSQRKG